MNIPLTVMYTPLEENQVRQYIDAEQARKAWILAERRALNYRGSMYWKTVKGRDYLYREYRSGSAKSLGVRSADTENIIEEFKKGKQAAEQNLKQLNTAMTRMPG